MFFFNIKPLKTNLQDYATRTMTDDEDRIAALERNLADKERELKKLKDANDALHRDILRLRDDQTEKLAKMNPSEVHVYYNCYLQL